MAADSNMGFHHGVMHMLSFQSESMNMSIPPGMGMAGSVNTGNFSGQIGNSGGGGGGVFFSGNGSMVSNSMAAIGGGAPLPGPSSSCQQPQQDSGLTPEWTIEEQNVLRQGLIKYASEHSIMKYIKIAAMLRRKTVRDVAWRCRWLAKQESTKRCKLEEYYAGKKMNNRKEKMVSSCSKANMYMVNPGNVSSFAPIMHQVNQNDLFSCEVPALDGATQQLMDENIRMLHRISTNLATYKIQENADLFCHTRNNITTILNNMSNMPSIMSQMPPLPVMVNEELLTAILPGSNQAYMFGGPGIHLDQQPRPEDLL